MSNPGYRDYFTPEHINSLRHILRTLQKREKVTLSRIDRDVLLDCLPLLINAWDAEETE